MKRGISGLVLVVLFSSLVAAVVVDPHVIDVIQQEGSAPVIVVLDGQQQLEQLLDDVDVKDKSGWTRSFFGEEKQYDIDVQHQYSTIPALAGEVTPEGLEELQQQPGVNSVFLDEINTIFLSASVPLINASILSSFNGQAINGSGETVCIIDTGVNYSHAALGSCTTESFLNGTCSSVIGGYDFCADNNACTTEDNDPEDQHNHGTAMAGVIASQDSTYKGVAPGAKIVALKACNSGGSCRDSDVLASLEWCVTNSTKYNISVVSISLGRGSYTSACDSSINSNYATLINQAVDQNISVVVATGNSAGSTVGIEAPSCIANATRASATDKSDVIASYAMRHANFPDILLAPGSNVVTTDYLGGFSSGTGTSLSTPHIAGAIAVIQQYSQLIHNTSLTSLQLKQVLNLTGKLIADATTGVSYARIDVNATLNALDASAPLLMLITPTPAADATTGRTIALNVSSSEVLHRALLEWNGTNESMNILATIASLPKSNLSRGNYSFRIWGSDFTGNTGLTEIRTITVANAIPVMLNVSLVPSPATTTVNLTCTGSSADSDNDPIILNYRWYKNGDEKELTTAVLDAELTTKGEQWQCGITPFDGAEYGTTMNSSIVFINNSLPTTVALLTPAANYSQNTSVDFQWGNSTDNDGDGINYTFLLSSTSLFQNVIDNITVSAPGTIRNLNEQQYYWRVDSCDGEGCLSSSVQGLLVDGTFPIANLSLSMNGTSPVVITLLAATNEPADCRFGETDQLYNNLLPMSTTGNLSHSVERTYRSDTSGTYYLRCRDYAANTMNASATIAFTADVTEPSSGGGGNTGGTGGGDAGGGGGGTSTGTTPSESSTPAEEESSEEETEEVLPAEEPPEEIPSEEVAAARAIETFKEAFRQLPQPDGAVKELFDQAQDAVAEGDFTEALRLIEEAQTLLTQIQSGELTGATVTGEIDSQLTGAAVTEESQPSGHSFPWTALGITSVVILFMLSAGYFLFVHPPEWGKQKIVIRGKK